mmetsp:Transcript_24222/g.62432  ORF Transcript_24222/g.62432 Transcript_24222/m.62432 type:complete len:225 (-) Transcript_24222:396-1070(-)
MHPDTSTARELYDPTSRGDYSPQSVLYRPDLYANFVEFYLHNNIASEVDALRSAASDEDGDITNAELVHELGACFNTLTEVLNVTASVKAIPVLRSRYPKSMSESAQHDFRLRARRIEEGHRPDLPEVSRGVNEILRAADRAVDAAVAKQQATAIAHARVPLPRPAAPAAAGRPPAPGRGSGGRPGSAPPGRDRHRVPDGARSNAAAVSRHDAEHDSASDGNDE